ncbi:hypothetical protein WMY93_011424 [Mugilogobius chulae]|uniref:Uncharacterized protein n=1 Tax=Mugilogobius chulae TaxID=88201 RepID=A0AAW0P8N1_9GOBI
MSLYGQAPKYISDTFRVLRTNSDSEDLRTALLLGATVRTNMVQPLVGLKHFSAAQICLPDDVASMWSATEKDLICPICHDIFQEPVLLLCSHSFCKKCITKWWTEKPTRECPVCNASSPQNPPSNLALKILCDTHLHTQSCDVTCSLHAERLQLYCLTDQQPVCVVCRDSCAHKDHHFSPVNEAAIENREKLRLSLLPLEEKHTLLQQFYISCSQTLDHIKQQAQNTHTHISNVYSKLHQFLEEEKKLRLIAVKEEEEQKTQKTMEKMSAVSKELEALGESEKLSLAGRSTAGPETLIDQAKHLSNTAFNIWTNMKTLVEYRPFVLDPNTANPALLLSDDLTTVRHAREKSLPENPERFDVFQSVLGSQGFDSGTHSWVVKVENNSNWLLGVVSESSGERERTSQIQAYGGSVCVGESLLTFKGTRGGVPERGEDEHPIRTDTTASDHGNEQTDSSKKCVCGKTCKNQRGLKIHQARMKCLEVEIPAQRTGVQPGETQEEPGLELPHRAQNLQVKGTSPPSMKFEKRRIKWPAANMSSQWSQFDSDVDQILEATGKGDVDKKLLSLTTMIVNIGAERFGQEERKEPSIGGHPMNKREIKIHNIRQEMKSLRRQYKYAGEYERLGLAHLMSIQRKKIGVLRRAEWHRRRRRERSRKRAAFISDPFRFTKQLLGQKRNGKLECSQEELDHYLDDVYSDPTREQDLGECKILIEPPPPTVPYDVSELRLSEVSEVIKKARAGSAPGPSGTCYKVYKNCPKLLTRLWKILRVIWRRGRIPEFWKAAEGVLIPKEENSKKIDQFRIISLLCVEAKIFFSAVSRRLCSFLGKNNFVDTSVQKGGVPGVSGCLEHTGVVTQLIREARENKGNLSVLWLDLENAYGSIPHKLVQLTLTKHHVPQRVIDLVTDYYSNFRIRVSSGAVTSSWHNLELGIITGCTISVMLFSLAMNMIVKSAEPECRGPKSKSGQRQPPIRAFMDDLTVTTESVSGCRWILQGLQKLVKWARMSFKPAKSRSMVLRKGSVDSKFQFSIAGTAIPTISEKPVKSLGKVFDSSLKDTESIKVTIASLDTWLKAVDRSGLPGKFKAWIYQHGVLPEFYGRY